MDEFELIMSRLSNFATDFNTYVSLPMDSNLNLLSPINDINTKLKAFQNQINIAHLNSVSIALHRDEIFRLIVKTYFDIVGFSETNIKKNTPSHLFKFPGYKLFKSNREGRKFGGVGILIRDELALKAKKININLNETL